MRSSYTKHLSAHTESKSFAKIHYLRKIKIFVEIDKITLVTYYKNYTKSHDEYIGNAYICNFKNRRMTIVSLAHTGQAPPTNREQIEDENIDNPESEEVYPFGIGAQLIPA